MFCFIKLSFYVGKLFFLYLYLFPFLPSLSKITKTRQEWGFHDFFNLYFYFLFSSTFLVFGFPYSWGETLWADKQYKDDKKEMCTWFNEILDFLKKRFWLRVLKASTTKDCGTLLPPPLSLHIKFYGFSEALLFMWIFILSCSRSF